MNYSKLCVYLENNFNKFRTVENKRKTNSPYLNHVYMIDWGVMNFRVKPRKMSNLILTGKSSHNYVVKFARENGTVPRATFSPSTWCVPLRTHTSHAGPVKFQLHLAFSSDNQAALPWEDESSRQSSSMQ